jgi:SAM-dependent methyltransferase
MSQTKSKIRWSTIDSFVGNSTSQSLTFHRPCPICGSLRTRTILALNDFQFFSDSATLPKRVDIHQCMCLDCHAIYMNPCYSTYGFKVLFAEAGQSYGSTEGRPLEQIDWLEQRSLIQPGSRLLDVGCYDGSFLARLPEYVQKLGVDIDAPAIERGQKQHADQEIEFFLGDFETFAFSGAAPDTITMFHVLEHLPRPVQVLKKLRDISSQSTRLVVEVPILENGKTNDINGFLSVQHMTHFSRASLDNCLKLAGWEAMEYVEQADYNGCRVLAKPKDMATSLATLKTPSSDWLSLNDYLETWHSSLKDVEAKVLSLPDSKQIVIWGGGCHTEFLYQCTSLFSKCNDRLMCIIDSDKMKHGKTWRGLEIYSPNIIPSINWEETILLISSYGGQDSIYSAAINHGVLEKAIRRIYSFIKRY